MLESHRIGICTLYAPYASRRRGWPRLACARKCLNTQGVNLEPASGLEPLPC